MYLLDTNVISEPMKASPDDGVLAWLAAHKEELFIPSVALDELHYGVLRLPDGRRKEGYRGAIGSIAGSYSDKVVPFDARAAWVSAEFRWAAHASGRHPGVQDMMVAAMAKANGMTLVTRNTKDFEFLGIDVFNPFGQMT